MLPQVDIHVCMNYSLFIIIIIRSSCLPPDHEVAAVFVFVKDQEHVALVSTTSPFNAMVVVLIRATII